MRKRSVFTSLTSFVSLAVLLTLPAIQSLAEPNTSPIDPVTTQDETKTVIPLIGKWIVRSVDHDASPTAAQIGQKPGDIIHFEKGTIGDIRVT